jgi:uncharacterized OB-fold protein
MTSSVDFETFAGGGRPLPAVDPVSKEYWDAAARGELLYQECPSCGHRQHYPRAVCTNCAATPEYRTAAGTGTIHTFTIVRQTGAAPFKDWVPYPVAMVELDEGPRILGNVVGVGVDDVKIGQRVQVKFGDAGEGVFLPFWEPASDGR